MYLRKKLYKKYIIVCIYLDMDTEQKQTTETTDATAETSPVELGQTQKEVRLVDIEIVDDNVALNLMVSFLNLAQRRGAYGMDESAKIWECVQRFIQTK